MLHTQSFRIHTAKLLGGFAILFLGFVTLGFQSKTHPQDEEINRTVSALNSDGDKAIFYHVKIDANGAATVTKSVLTTIAGVQNQLCLWGGRLQQKSMSKTIWTCGSQKMKAITIIICRLQKAIKHPL